jgi:plasmid stabilization system protein ParE
MRIEVSRAAVEDIERLRVTHSLPADTNERIRNSLRALEQFPRLGIALEGSEWEGLRFLLGPWRWMVIVYEVLDAGGRVVIVTVQDGRSSRPATVRAPG